MSRINRVPFGLQFLLDSQNFGKNPNDLSEITAGTIDLSKFWESLLTRHETTVTAINSIGQGGIIKVPEGELWQISDFAVEYLHNFAAGAQTRSAFRIAVPDGSSGFSATRIFAIQSTNDPSVGGGTGERSGYSYQANYPGFFPSGTEFTGLCVGLDLAAGVSVSQSFVIVFRQFKV